MSSQHFRPPTDAERAFLRIVARGHSELERQIETCELADDDPTGWCDVNVLGGPPAPIRDMVDGPALISDDPQFPFVETFLWTDDRGLLSSVEFLAFGQLAEPYDLFVKAAAANPSRLRYPPCRAV
jgi:hypothetical protein